MNFTYKIENYSPYESRLFVLYTPEDTTKETLGAWVTVEENMSADQIKDAIVRSAPVDKWNKVQSEEILSLINTSGSGTFVPPIQSIPVGVPPDSVLVGEVATPEMIKDSIIKAAQHSLDDFAKQKGYDSLLSATSYANSSIPSFMEDAKRAILLRDQTWAKLYEIMDEVKNGTRPMPESFETIKSELPDLRW